MELLIISFGQLFDHFLIRRTTASFISEPFIFWADLVLLIPHDIYVDRTHDSLNAFGTTVKHGHEKSGPGTFISLREPSIAQKTTLHELGGIVVNTPKKF